MKKIALLTAVALLTTFTATSKTYTVSITADAGLGSLRAAIDSANANPGQDSIILNLSSASVIYLQSALDNITDSLIITGQACNNPTINGGQVTLGNAALNVASATIPLTVNYINFLYCNNVSAFASGGAINAGFLYLNYCYFHGNSAIDNSNNDLSDGGAVAANYTRITSCTFDSNSVGNNSGDGPAALGGAVYFNFLAGLYNCTFNNNQTDNLGGAVYGNNVLGDSIVNCTFINNGSVANSFFGGGALYLNLNGGPSVSTIDNNIFWNNNGIETPGEVWVNNGSVTSSGCNILQAAGNDQNFNTVAGDIQGTDPQLGTLGYYGGCVPTIPIGCTSVAINHATCPGATSADARGVVAGGVRDAGAFQLAIPVVTLGNDTTHCGSSVTLFAGNPGATYAWSNGSTADSTIATTPGQYTVTVTNATTCSVAGSVNVYLQTLPTVYLGTPVSQCGGNVTLDAANPGDTYLWSNSQTTQTTIVSNTNTYHVTVTDPVNHCSATGSVLVSIDAVPVVTLGGPYTQCGGTVTLNAQQAGSTYAWSNGSTNATLIASRTGYYEVTVTNAGNCSASGAANVTINPVPSVYLPADTTACGNLVVLNAGAGPGYTYLWQDESTGQTDTAKTAGTYTVTVTNSYSCSASAQSVVALPNTPVVNLGPDVNQCGGFVPLSAGNNGDTYVWSTGSTNQLDTATTSGTYIVTVTDPSTCSATGSVQIYIQTQPFVNLGPDTNQCGGTITLDAGNPGDNYIWSGGETTQTITVSNGNNYSVTVTDPNGGCSASSSLFVGIYPVPVVNLGPGITQCGGQVTLDAGNTGSYVWSNGATTETITVATSGTYIVTVSAGEFVCTASSSVEVYINTVPSVYLGPDITQCGGSTTLDAGNPEGYTFAWSTTATTQTIQVDSTSAYSVTVTSLANGCSAADTINVTIDTLPVVNLGHDTTQCGGTVTLLAGNAGSTYLWSDNTIADSLLVSISGTYRVTVTNSNGCTATGSITVTINPIPVVTMSLPAPYNVCMTAAPFALFGGMPAGGTYFEADTAITTFSPVPQGIGPHVITYVFANIYGCMDSDSALIVVRPQPLLTSVTPPYICTTSAELNVNDYITPSNGIYTGRGISGNYFYPNLVQAGLDTIVDVYTDSFGCMDTLAYPIRVHEPVHVTLTSSVADFTICQNQAITFTSGGAEFYQFFVNDSAQGAPTTDSTFTTTTLSNHSTIYVVGSNPCSTDTSELMVIDVITPPVVSAGGDTTINLGQTVELHGVATGTGSLTYLWTPGNGLNFINVPNPTYSGSDSITFTFKATDHYGCADSAQVSVYVFVPDNVLLPTVITPNGDGFNDVWKLNSKIDLDGSHLVIFDRWGMVVYETENYANNWGGTYKGTGKVLPDDTYYYVLKVPAQNNHVYEGPINIISGNTK